MAYDEGPINYCHFNNQWKGLLPSKETDAYWIYAVNPTIEKKRKPELIGKWLISIKSAKDKVGEIDQQWEIICRNIRNGYLGDCSAKISSKLAAAAYLEGKYPYQRIVCVYTKDYRDKEERNLVRDKLRKLGFTRPLCYKTDNQTRADSYGHQSHLVCFVK